MHDDLVPRPGKDVRGLTTNPRLLSAARPEEAQGATPAYWDRRVTEFERRYEQPGLIDFILRRDAYLGRSLVLHEAQRLRPCSVLDIGCGPGIVLKELLSGPAHLGMGIDSSPAMIAAATKRLSTYYAEERCNLELGEFGAYEFGARRFDLVFALGVFDYVADPSAFLRSAAQLATGSLIFNVPDMGLFTTLRRLKHRQVQIRAFGYGGLKELCRASGLTRSVVTHTPGAFHVVARVAATAKASRGSD